MRKRFLLLSVFSLTVCGIFLNSSHAYAAVPAASVPAIEATNYYNFTAYGGDGNYLYGISSAGTYVVKVDINGVVTNGKSVTTINPATKTYNGGVYTGSGVSRVWTTSVDGEIYLTVYSAAGKYYLFRSLDGGAHFGSDANATNDDYVSMLGDIDGTEANQKAAVYIHGNGSFIEATIGGQRTFLYTEYHNITSPAVAPVRVMKSTDGINWTQVVQFNVPGVLPASIQHIHLLRQDPYSDDIYIGTGDSDNQSGIIVWDGTGTLPNDAPENYPSYNDPNFTAIGGSQQYRALGFLFTPDHFFWGVDSAGNALGGIWRADRETLANITSADNSVLSLGSVGKREEMGYALKASDGTLLFLDYRDLTLTYPHNVWASGDNGATWTRIADIMPNVGVSSYNFTAFFEWKGKIYISSVSGAMAGKYTVITIEAELSGTFDGTRTVLHPVYWVSPSGTDSAPLGTSITGIRGWSSNTPWKTLSYALSGNRVTNGGRVILAPGTYSLEVGTTTAWSGNTRPGPIDLEVYVQGAAATSTFVYLPSSAATSSLLELRGADGQLRLSDLSLWSEKSDSNVLYVESGGSLTLQNTSVGSTTVDLGTGSTLLNYGTTTVTKSTLQAHPSNNILYSGAASKATSTQSIYVNGLNSIYLSNPTRFTSYNDAFANYAGFGINIDVNSTVPPKIKNGVFGSAATYAIKDFAGLSETDIDYNCYQTGVDASVTDGGNSLLNILSNFVNALLDDFHLLPASTCIDHGADLGFTTDYAESAIVGTPDIGPYEFQGPSVPTSLNQYKTDGTTAIASGGNTDETSIKLTFSMTSANNTDSLIPQVEVQPVGTAFTGTASFTGDAVAYSGASVIGTTTVTGLTAGTSYHWQGRVTNVTGTSSWVTMSGGTDFEIEAASTPSPSPTPTAEPIVSRSGSGAANRVSNLISMGFYSQAEAIARQYNIAVPLRSQLASQNIVTNVKKPSPFIRSLGLRSTGLDVKALQVYLNTHGYLLTKSGPGSPGQETEYFGVLTWKALMKMQKASYLPMTGFFGPLSRMLVEN